MNGYEQKDLTSETFSSKSIKIYTPKSVLIELRIDIVTSSIYPLYNLAEFRKRFSDFNEINLNIIDEGDEVVRKINSKLLTNIEHNFYGPKERIEWFKKLFGESYEQYADVIPERCHAETSFGFLIAYDDMPDIVIEIDDDTYPIPDYDLIEEHTTNLGDSPGLRVCSEGRWYNTIDALQVKNNVILYPRGHPYNRNCRSMTYDWEETRVDCILNMGLWTGQMDLDALTILYHNGLDGRCDVTSERILKNKIIVGKGTYFAVCSMNASFRPAIIPSFYQLYMNHLGIDRFDDIWSGIFLKKICDYLDHNVSLGRPAVYHDKRPRSVFKDLLKELGGLDINEKLWHIVDESELSGSSFPDAYLSLIESIEKKLSNCFSDEMQKKFLFTQLENMRKWVEITDKL